MVLSMMVIGHRIRLTDTENKPGKMAKSIMVNGLKTTCQVTDSISMQTKLHMMASLRMTKRLDLGSTSGLMVGYILAGGLTEDNMGTVPILEKRRYKNMVFGNMVNVSPGLLKAKSNPLRVGHSTTKNFSRVRIQIPQKTYLLVRPLKHLKAGNKD